MNEMVVTEWFVEPSDAHTNEVIVKNLIHLGQYQEGVNLIDNSGAPHFVFPLESHTFITRLYKDQIKFILRFKVFYRRGVKSPLRLWRFEEASYKRAKKAKKRIIKKGKF
ncbi:MAG: hypothetical protein PHH52_01880 [Patescibacteria group bacterium]|jgi:hypothetical protein|nr:hypothetical protein [Patescibacteria group bacterium]MDD3778110.1 hypothetical protein [Patescibacteria group bacterium]MDD3939042.1 hypothetical protein [Patescibacteria group bacterium]MDD4443656.1 hypothetical protein [Patescibacteria group bacterium]NCU39729.1 hypothetical protein [Candidatus Falkowbacteria bacterium]